MAELIEDPLLMQLKKIRTEISTWDLMCTSRQHHEKIIRPLNYIVVPSDILPDCLVNHVTGYIEDLAIIFTKKDLPKEGSAHNKACFVI